MAEEQEREVELEEEERNTSRITCEFYTIHPGDFCGVVNLLLHELYAKLCPWLVK